MKGIATAVEHSDPRKRERSSKLELRGPRNGGAFCADVCADAESVDETGRRARLRRFSGGSGMGGARRGNL
eukprot:8422884-Alexandrium_andersonii.AAC.1